MIIKQLDISFPDFVRVLDMIDAVARDPSFGGDINDFV